MTKRLPKPIHTEAELLRGRKRHWNWERQKTVGQVNLSGKAKRRKSWTAKPVEGKRYDKVTGDPPEWLAKVGRSYGLGSRSGPLAPFVPTWHHRIMAGIQLVAESESEFRPVGEEWGWAENSEVNARPMTREDYQRWFHPRQNITQIAFTALDNVFDNDEDLKEAIAL